MGIDWNDLHGSCWWLLEYVDKYATADAIEAHTDASEDDEDMSSIESFSDEETAGMEL